MGQYFAAVNTDKKEFVCPWCVGGVAKLWEWAANPWGAIFTLLLRQSTGGGGGDYGSRGTQVIDVGDGADALAKVVAQGVAREGAPIGIPKQSIVGRWAGDRVALVGDYDASKLWNELYERKTFRNISEQIVTEWNDFIEIEAMKLKYRPCSSCADSS